MTSIPIDIPESQAHAPWREIVRPFESPSTVRSVLQVVSTLTLLAGGFYLMAASLTRPYWVTFLLSIPTAALLLRTFAIMHDCAHGSLFKSRAVNDVVGWFTAVLTLTPYIRWRHEHSLHHATTGDLDRRGDGDIWTMTVEEYHRATTRQRLAYRLYRNPLIFLTVGPIKYALLMRQRPTGNADGPRERASVRETNLAILALFVAGAAVIGPLNLLLIYVPAYMIATAVGIWLIWVQHQFEDTYWADHEHWDYMTAAIMGSSYFKLPALINWFTCSIGFHHVHHLSPRIPNYRLRAAHESNVAFQQARTITLRESPSTARLTLWDEQSRRLVPWIDRRSGSGWLRRSALLCLIGLGGMASAAGAQDQAAMGWLLVILQPIGALPPMTHAGLPSDARFSADVRIGDRTVPHPYGTMTISARAVALSYRMRSAWTTLQVGVSSRTFGGGPEGGVGADPGDVLHMRLASLNVELPLLRFDFGGTSRPPVSLTITLDPAFGYEMNPASGGAGGYDRHSSRSASANAPVALILPLTHTISLIPFVTPGYVKAWTDDGASGSRPTVGGGLALGVGSARLVAGFRRVLYKNSYSDPSGTTAMDERTLFGFGFQASR